MNFVCVSGVAKDDAWIRKNEKGLLIASFTLLVDVEKLPLHSEENSAVNEVLCIGFDRMADKAGLAVKKGCKVEVTGMLTFYTRVKDNGDKSYEYSIQMDHVKKTGDCE